MKSPRNQLKSSRRGNSRLKKTAVPGRKEVSKIISVSKISGGKRGVSTKKNRQKKNNLKPRADKIILGRKLLKNKDYPGAELVQAIAKRLAEMFLEERAA